MLTPDNNSDGQPPKKRVRYARPPKEVPEGFVREEIDEEESDDPDFELDAIESPANDYNHPYDPVDESDVPSVGVRTRSSELFSRESSEHNTPDFGNNGELGENIQPHEDAEFQVEDLDSSEEDDEPSFADGNDDSGDILDIENDDEDEDSEGRAKEYMDFLQSLMKKHDKDDQVGGDANNIQHNTESPSLDLEANDEDFNYLLEAAKIPDDPLEYRHDYHVSRRELNQLLAQNRGKTGQRKTTRASKKRKESPGQGRKKSRLDTASKSLMIQKSRSEVPITSTPLKVLPTAKQSAPIATSGTTGLRAGSKLPLPEVQTFANFPSQITNNFNYQMAVHVQILATIHAGLATKKRVLSERGSNSIVPKENDAQLKDLDGNLKRTTNLINGLIDASNASNLYHQVMNNSLARLKPFAEKALMVDRNPMFKYKNQRRCMYNLSVLKLLPIFIQDCNSLHLGNMPSIALQRLQPHFFPNITTALSVKKVQRKISGSHKRKGWYEWTSADDKLLAMMIAKYGSDTAGFKGDLLPHRLNEDCMARIRYLSSRRCEDNLVKTQMMNVTSPLSKEEIEIVAQGLAIYGRDVDDPEVWKRIQRDLIPGREWSHVRKLWIFRETRRKYKAQYRAKRLMERSKEQAAKGQGSQGDDP